MTDSAPPLDFYFDFSSPYGYLMSEKIDAVAARYGARCAGIRSCSASSSRPPAARR
jgi:2-hydroxychromene-2-carboxylate isomerase